MKNKILLITFFFALFHSTYSQKNNENASIKYDQLAYIDVIKIYEKVIEKGFESEKIYKKLGDSYYFNAQYQKALISYGNLIKKYPNQSAEYYFRFASTLKSNGEHELSKQMMLEFYNRNKLDSRAIMYFENQNYLDEIEDKSKIYLIENLSINSKFSDYGTTIYKNKIIFTSARERNSVIKRKHSWTGESFTTLYEAIFQTDDSLNTPQIFSNSINSKFHIASPIFTKDGNTMYFTSNSNIKGKKDTNANETVLLKIYKVTFENKKWQNVIELPFNNNNYNCAHPALSADEKYLYFVSDMPGSIGQSDLYKVEIKQNDTFGIPENLGPEINTEGRETFPFIDSNNILYFATNGRPGLGGLDVFAAQKNSDGNYTFINNLGKPINSSSDDFAFVIKNDSIGYVTSNRIGGKGNDDIYKLALNKPINLKIETNVNAILVDDLTNNPLPNANITIFDENYEHPIKIKSSDNGEFVIPNLDINTKYIVRIEKAEFETKDLPILFSSKSSKNILKISLQPVTFKIKVGDDLAKIFNIEKIYFDIDKWEIREDAANDLSKIVEVLYQFPNMKIDVRSHTDSRATKQYNEKLSERRAQSTINWITKQGIEISRLTGKGYGENQLINECSDGISCTESQHQLNRRSEFIITEM